MIADLTPKDFNQLIGEIARRNGISEDLAGDYLLAIGDAPEVDAQGRAIVRSKDGGISARLILPVD